MPKKMDVSTFKSFSCQMCQRFLEPSVFSPFADVCQVCMWGDGGMYLHQELCLLAKCFKPALLHLDVKSRDQ